ncbi:RHS repeat-associated core domain-containing protein [Parapedobacter sp. 10938]|uniref:RHS repeat-associated core domain-containing protein n=1 Tax=Parapedobacter flavus TaxID=3110225 RepID=UPI002DBF1176|nr:RHS repeat-associated core domain-containing protein [Parapedobacter sp. 10938]MEC3880222.1 RHS repeat-associated core domain-containing protein [Parapedobacter sp. 10938]
MKNINYIYIIVLLQLLSTSVVGQNRQNLPVQGSNSIVDNTISGNITSQTLPSAYNANGNTAPTLFNYTRTYEPLTPNNNTASINVNSHPTLVNLSTDYKDGWGRTMEKVHRNKTSSMSQHLVECFDNRPSNSTLGFLPYISSTFKFQLSPYANQHNYYPVEERGSALSKKITTVTKSDNTIADYTYLPGKTSIGQDRATEINYKLNANNEVYNLDMNENTGKPEKVGFYNSYTLDKKIITTPDGHYKEEFYDKDEKLICIKELIEGSDYRHTYYVYDNFDRLSHIISPKAFDILVINNWQFTNSLIEDLMDYFVYDDFGKVIEKHTSGQIGNEFYVYDKKDRKVLSQTPYQRQNAQWSFTLYDKLDRPTITGLLVSNNSVINRQTWQTWLTTTPCPINSNLNTPSNLEYYIGFDNGEGNYPTSLSHCVILTYTYYDDYDYVSNIPFDPTVYTGYTTNSIYAVQPTVNYRTKGYKTATKTRVLKSTVANPSYFNNVLDWVTTVYFYDNNGRVIQTKTQNHRNGWDISATQYDFKGKILNTIIKHNNPLSSKTNTNVYTNHIYNTVTQQPTVISHKIDNASLWKNIAAYSYDDLGRISRKSLGSIENQDYTYNVRGDLTGINAHYAEGAYASKVTFGEAIKYYNNAFSDIYHDGNISGIIWKGPGVSKPRAYGYVYDKLGRLLSGDYREFGNTHFPTGPVWHKYETNFTENNITYDKNGNIKTLDRYGLGLITGAVLPTIIDQLNYTYANGDASNKLQFVTDAISVNNQLSDYDFKDNNTTNVDYVYNPSGKMEEDKNKGIVIYNNHFNKPESVQFNNGDFIHYVYDASGNKLMEIYQGSNNDIYDYIGTFTYKNLELYTVAHEEGYALRNPDNTFTYHFFVKDHLGNVRNIITPVEMPIPFDYLATHEIASAGLESFLFGNIDDVRDDNPDSPDPGDVMAARLNASEQDHKIGTSIVLKVMAGDKIGLSANSYYEGAFSNETEPSAEDMLSAIISTLSEGLGGFEGGAENNGIDYVEQLFSTTNYVDAYHNILHDNTDPNKPKAFLNYIFFDENYHIVPEESGAIQISGDAGEWQQLGTQNPLTVGRNGYLSVYISTLTYNLDVFMDQISISHYVGQLVEENHYYPYGLTVNIASNNPVKNRYLYTSAQLEKHNNLHWYDLMAREYDPQLGRFTAVDPLADANKNITISPYAAMADNPISYTDQDGRCWQKVGDVYIPCANLSVGATTTDVFGYNWTMTKNSGWQLTNGVNPHMVQYQYDDIEVTGNENYYVERYKNHISKYNTRPPDYYLGYGHKYFNRFNNETRATLSDVGKEWLDETAISLQIKMNEGINATPSIQGDNTAFTKFAYSTHVPAYTESGKFGQLGVPDLWKIMQTPDGLDSYFSFKGLHQIIQILPHILNNPFYPTLYLNSPINPGMLKPWEIKY